jgi:phosphatidylglycerophosphatase A
MRASALVASFFGAGYLPKAPGTWGSLAALPIAWLITMAGGNAALAIAALLVFIIGVIASNAATDDTRESDPSWIVIDEVAGQWLTLLAAPLSLFGYVAAFALFRLFDIWKPWPIKWSERRFDGGLGIMIDDVLAAIYAMIVLVIGRMLLER